MFLRRTEDHIQLISLRALDAVHKTAAKSGHSEAGYL